VLRANYQTYLWKHADQATVDVTSPVGCGWTADDNNLLHVDWTGGYIIPQSFETEFIFIIIIAIH